MVRGPLPALLTTALTFGEPRYASLKGIMGAKKKSIASLSLQDLSLDLPVGTDGSKTELRKLRAAGSARAKGRSSRQPMAPPARKRSSISFRRRGWLSVRNVIVYAEHRKGRRAKLRLKWPVRRGKLAAALGGKAYAVVFGPRSRVPCRAAQELSARRRSYVNDDPERRWASCSIRSSTILQAAARGGRSVADPHSEYALGPRRRRAAHGSASCRHGCRRRRVQAETATRWCASRRSWAAR